MSQFLPLELTPKAEYSLQQSNAAERVGQLNELGQSTYEKAEISLADLRRQLIVGRNWKHIVGLSDLLSSMLSHNKDRHYNHMMGMGLVPLTHLKAYMQAVESAYGQGLLPSPIEATTEQITNYFADVITDRELDGATIIEKYERGEIPLTPLEQEAFELAQQWDSILRAGQVPPEAATASGSTYQSIEDKWDKVASVTPQQTSVSPTRSSTPTRTTTTTRYTSQAPKASETRSSAIPSFRGLIPNTPTTTLTTTSKIFAMIAFTYAVIQYHNYRKSKK